MSHEYSFSSPLTGQVDRERHIIKGASLITGDLEAKGHGLQVDDTTLQQIYDFAARKGQITVKADHKSADGKTFKAIVGYFTNFSLDKHSKKVRGDLHLLESEPLTPKIEEMAERMPGNFGPSVAFRGDSQTIGGKLFARCKELVSVDLVENPAANPDGMFAAKPVDNPSSGNMPTENNTNTDPMDDAPPWAKELATKLSVIDERLGQVEEFHGHVMDAMNDDGDGAEPPDGDGEPAGDPNDDDNRQMSEVEQALAEIRTFRAEMARARELAAKEEEETKFAEVESKITALAGKNKELVTELEAKEAEVKALRLALKTGDTSVRPSAHGGGSKVTQFGQYEADSFEHFVNARYHELREGNKDLSPAKAKSQAIEFCIRKYPGAYVEYRERNGKVIFFEAK